MSGTTAESERIRSSVRARYGRLARVEEGSCCGESDSSGSCGTSGTQGRSDCCAVGYSEAEREAVPAGSILGLGCGNPSRLVALAPGQVVLDLGSGAGVDCFLAASQVGPTGRVIGVDMTPEMVSRARELARTNGSQNVEFRLGEIEHLPVADSSVDVVLSNCVINLAPDKRQVYREAFRVLRPGGRLAVADVLATRPIRDELRADPELWGSCSSGALSVTEVTETLREAGFQSIDVTALGEDPTPESLRSQADLGVVPGEVRARKPGGTRP
jgi:arsenite methyltransferase